jgi:hypothetical protein
LSRFIIYGSYVTAKYAPNDVDVLLLMTDDFRSVNCDAEKQVLFDHLRTHDELGASIFWTRPASIILETENEFIAYWQIKRDNTQHGIVEVIER